MNFYLEICSSAKLYVVGTQKNCFIVTVLLSTQNIKIQLMDKSCRK